MNSAVVTLISLSVSGSLLALALFALKPVMKAGCMKAFAYYIWLIVLIRLMLPVGAPVNAMDALFSGIPVATAQEAVTVSDNNTGADAPDTNCPATDEAASVISDIAVKSWAFIKSRMLWIWAAGVCASLLWFVTGYLRFCRQIRRTSTRPLPEDDAVFRHICGGGRVRLAYNEYVTTPILIGLFSPTIIVPPLAYCRNGMKTEFENILRHEMTHYKRRDIIYKWLAVLVSSVHWFNPLMILLRREIARACELSCDEAVIRNMSDGDKQKYGETLLALSASRKLPAGILATTLCQKRSELRERLASIMKYKKQTIWTIAISVLFAFLLTGCGTALGVVNSNTEALPPDEVNTVMESGESGSTNAAAVDEGEETLSTLTTTNITDVFLSYVTIRVQSVRITGLYGAEQMDADMLLDMANNIGAGFAVNGDYYYTIRQWDDGQPET
jgi:Antirepressor regulating drug resistance, predicted signal transduction N-terminal membrane component